MASQDVAKEKMHGKVNLGKVPGLPGLRNCLQGYLAKTRNSVDLDTPNLAQSASTSQAESVLNVNEVNVGKQATFQADSMLVPPVEETPDSPEASGGLTLN